MKNNLGLALFGGFFISTIAYLVYQLIDIFLDILSSLHGKTILGIICFISFFIVISFYFYIVFNRTDKKK